MRLFLIILILILSFQSLTKADDIKDFIIEKVSLGDSLLKHYNKDDIKFANETKVVYPNKEFYDLQLDVKNFEIWPLLSFSLKQDDSNFIIHSLAGGKLMSLEKCEIQKKKIIKDLKSSFFSELKEKKYDFIYKDIGDGKSIALISHFILSNGSLRVYCTDWSDITEKETGYADSLRLEIGTIEYFDWLNTKAYKG
tara:strand:+ start:1098 stop:1685 length:588 start_codon:yes stop_codon:yes gene_type:complete